MAAAIGPSRSGAFHRSSAAANIVARAGSFRHVGHRATRHGADHAVWGGRGDGERIRTTCRDSNGVEAVELKVVCDCEGIGNPSADRASWLRRRESVPRAIDPDETKACRRGRIAAWSDLVANGVVAPIDTDVMYHTVVGAASLLYVNAPEAQLLGVDTSAFSLVDRHADALINMFLRPQPHQPESEKTQ